MRLLLRVSIPMDQGNATIKDGILAKSIQSMVQEQKPEVVYFCEMGGLRTEFVVVNIQEPSQIPGITEPWFLAFKAPVEIRPAMTVEDLMKAGPAIAQAVKNYG